MITELFRKNKIIYIVHGDLTYISRAKKQIDTLLKNAFSVKVYNGYFKPTRSYNGLNYNIEKSKIYEGSNKILNFIGLMLFNYKFYKKIRNEEFDIIICRELSILLTGVLLKRKKTNVKLIFDNNELSVEKFSGISKKIWNKIQIYTLQYCDIVIHAEKNRNKYFISHFHIASNKQKHFVIENYPNKNLLFEDKENSKVKILYFGVIAPNRNIEELLLAFVTLKEYKLDLIGFGSKEYLQSLKKIIKKYNLTNVNILGPINDSDVYNIFKPYSVGIAFYPNTQLNNWYCAPNKVYQYLQSRMAILTTNNPGLVEIIDKYNFGDYVSKTETKSIKIALKNILENKLYNNITQQVLEEFSWENIESKFLEIVKQ